MSTVAERLRDGVSVHEVFPELEKILQPRMKALAYKFAPVLEIGIEDALQEARLSVFKAFEGYDYEKSNGGVKSFAHRAIKNGFLDLLYKATTQSRNPHTIYEDSEGQVQLVLHRRLPSLEQLMSPETGFSPLQVPCPEDTLPERMAEGELMSRKIRVLALRLSRKLKRSEREVFYCWTRPPEAFQLYLRNIGVEPSEATNIHIASYLGVGKNTVDYAIHKIKGHFADLAEGPEFSDIIRELVEEGKWPMIYTSDKADDVEFVKRILKEKNLEPIPAEKSRDIQVSGTSGRIVERYHWGVIVHLKYRSREATLVIEGRFNKLSGDVFGESGYWKTVADTIPWYKELAKELKA